MRSCFPRLHGPRFARPPSRANPSSRSPLCRSSHRYSKTQVPGSITGTPAPFRSPVTPSIEWSASGLWHGHFTNGDIKVKLSALADRQRAAAFGSLGRLMQELLQQIDLDYYRSAQLLIVRAELEQLRQGRSALADVERGSKIPLATAPKRLMYPNLSDLPTFRPSAVHPVGTEAAFFLALPR